jgi:hypothetical protein
VLEAFPLYQCTWQEWLDTCPDTYVVSGEGETREGHGAGHSPGSLELHFIDSVRQHVGLDERLPPNELVLGVSGSRLAKAYPIRDLSERGAILHDDLAGEPIVVFSRPGTIFALAYSPSLDDRLLTFEVEGGIIRDRETGSAWSVMGTAEAGPLTGRQLTFVRSYVEEWYTWAAAHPGTSILESP